MVPDSETVLSGPNVVHGIESSTITQCRILKPAPGLYDLPDEISSGARPTKKSKEKTVLLWSKRRFLKRLFEVKRRNNRR